MLRLAGSAASVLLCVHGVHYLVISRESWWRLAHNLADVAIFFGFGMAGLVAELFPRESVPYRLLKTNLPFLNTLFGRAAFYLLFGCFAMGNYAGKGVCGYSEEWSAWPIFCVISGIFMVSVGAATLAVGLKYRVTTRTSTERLLTVQPQIQPLASNEEDGRIMMPFAPFPSTV